MTDEDPRDDAIELAELQEDVLDEALLRRLFDDLDALAEIHTVQIKGAAAQRAQDRPVELREALDLLLSGSIRGAQVLYDHGGRSWCDTLIRQGDAHRLIRIEAPRRAESIA